MSRGNPPPVIIIEEENPVQKPAVTAGSVGSVAEPDEKERELLEEQRQRERSRTSLSQAHSFGSTSSLPTTSSLLTSGGNHHPLKGVTPRDLGEPTFSISEKDIAALTLNKSIATAKSIAESPDEDVIDFADSWACPSCTYRNHSVNQICEICQATNPEFAGLSDASTARSVGASSAIPASSGAAGYNMTDLLSKLNAMLNARSAISLDPSIKQLPVRRPHKIAVDSWICPACTEQVEEGIYTVCSHCHKQQPLRVAAMSLVLRIVNAIVNDPSNKKFRKLKTEKVKPTLDCGPGNSLLPVLHNLGFEFVENYQYLLADGDGCVPKLRQFLKQQSFAQERDAKTLQLGAADEDTRLRLESEIFILSTVTVRDLLRVSDPTLWHDRFYEGLVFMYEARRFELVIELAEELTQFSLPAVTERYVSFMLAVTYSQRIEGDPKINEQKATQYARRTKPCSQPNCQGCQNFRAQLASLSLR